MKRLIITEDEKRNILQMHNKKRLMETEMDEDTLPGGPNSSLPKEVQCVLGKIGASQETLPESCKTSIASDKKPDMKMCAMELTKKFPEKALEIASCFTGTGFELPKIPGIPF